jgi:hypothetical protein
MRLWANRVAIALILLSGLPSAGGFGGEAGSGSIHVKGPGIAPQLGFACCDHGVEAARNLFAQPGVLQQLLALHATVAMPVTTLSPQLVELVRYLSQKGIPVVVGIGLPADEGSYLNADNVPQAAARIAAFEQWSRRNKLRWAAVGLDVEPNFGELAQLSHHRWRMLEALVRRSLAVDTMERAQTAYAHIVRQIQAWGVPVQVYEMPYVPAEDAVHSNLADRLMRTPDVRGDQVYVMLYTSFARPADAGVISLLGRHAWGIAIGSTSGSPTPGAGYGPLDWSEFARDLIVASHLTRHVGVYNLEGCVRQGFLPRLIAMNWGETVVISAASMRRSEWHIGLFCGLLWLASNLLYLIGAAIFTGWLLWWMRARRRRRSSLEGMGAQRL